MEQVHRERSLVAAYGTSVPDIAEQAHRTVEALIVGQYQYRTSHIKLVGQSRTSHSTFARDHVLCRFLAAHSLCQYRTSHSTRVGGQHHTLLQYRTSRSRLVGAQQECAMPGMCYASTGHRIASA
eukprot:3667715-Rhodomonas_salina.4